MNKKIVEEIMDRVDEIKKDEKNMQRLLILLQTQFLPQEMICPHCGKSCGQMDVAHDEEEEEVQCFSCDGWFYAIPYVEISYECEKID